MSKRDANRARWIRIVGQCRASGLSKAEFARQQGLKIKDLQNWSHRLPGSAPADANKRKTVRPVPVSVRPDSNVLSGGSTQILNDIRSLQIAVGDSVSPERVATLIAAIRARSC